MHRTVIARLVLIALAVSAAGAARPARAGYAYILKDLRATTVGLGVNASGQGAGYSTIAGGEIHAVFWTPRPALRTSAPSAGASVKAMPSTPPARAPDVS